MGKSKYSFKAPEETLEELVGALAPSPEEPSAEALARYTAIPLLFDVPGGAVRRTGRVLFDSWQSGGVALRDTMAGHIRHIRLGTDKTHLDLVAARRQKGWEFTARVKVTDRTSHNFVLQVDKKKLLPGSGGYYHWTSGRVPKELQLISPDRQMAFEKLSWR